MSDDEADSDSSERQARPSRRKQRQFVVEEPEIDEGDEQSEPELAAVEVTSETWPNNVKQNHPQRLFKVRLNNGAVVSIVAEDLDNPERGTAEQNPFYTAVIQAWRHAGNAQPARKRKNPETQDPRPTRKRPSRRS